VQQNHRLFQGRRLPWLLLNNRCTSLLLGTPKFGKRLPVTSAIAPFIATRSSGTRTLRTPVALVSIGWKTKEPSSPAHSSTNDQDITALLANALSLSLSRDNDIVKDLIAEALNAAADL
jgi:hypothetical protein